MSYIRLRNGDEHYFKTPFNINIACIAKALSHINRYTGHVGAYSVAQHCVLVAEQLPDDLKLSGLLHDAPEFVLTDVSSPLKALLPDYKHIEAWYHNFFDTQLGVATEHPQVKKADAQVCVTEMRDFGFPHQDWTWETPLSLAVSVWSADKAKSRFIQAFIEYLPLAPVYGDVNTNTFYVLTKRKEILAELRANENLESYL